MGAKMGSALAPLMHGRVAFVEREERTRSTAWLRGRSGATREHYIPPTHARRLQPLAARAAPTGEARHGLL